MKTTGSGGTTFWFGYGGTNGVKVGGTLAPPTACACGCRDPRMVLVSRAALDQLRADAAAGDGGIAVTDAFLRDVQRLVHPDLHAETRKARATKVAAFCSTMLTAQKRRKEGEVDG